MVHCNKPYLNWYSVNCRNIKCCSKDVMILSVTLNKLDKPKVTKIRFYNKENQ